VDTIITIGLVHCCTSAKPIGFSMLWNLVALLGFSVRLLTFKCDATVQRLRMATLAARSRRTAQDKKDCPNFRSPSVVTDEAMRAVATQQKNAGCILPLNFKASSIGASQTTQ